MRVFWVSSQGRIRAVNMDSTTSVPEWAGQTVLSVSVLGPMEERRFIAFTQFQFGVIVLDANGCRIRSLDADRQIAIMTGVMIFPPAAAVLPYPVPNDVQREAIYAYITKRWPAVMALPQSKLSWHRALQLPTSSDDSRLRWSRQPFCDPE